MNAPQERYIVIHPAEIPMWEEFLGYKIELQPTTPSPADSTDADLNALFAPYVPPTPNRKHRRIKP